MSEQEQLTLNDLIPYLAGEDLFIEHAGNRLRIEEINVNHGQVVAWMGMNSKYLYFGDHTQPPAFDGNTGKLILRPLSDMTEEEAKEIRDTALSGKIKADQWDFLWWLIKNGDHENIPVWVYKRLCAWNIDVGNLIERGLAVAKGGGNG